jgi:cystathionine beta-lyase
MKYDFDTVRDRRGSDSAKWNKYGDGVLPLWVADMDFVSADPILRALHERVDHGFFGYAFAAEEFCQTIRLRLQNLYGWEVGEEDLFFLPGLVTGLNFAFHAYSASGEGVLVQPPVYHHFIKDPAAHGRAVLDPPLVRKGDSYEIDFDAFEKAITPQTRIFVLCNPHNPVARVYTRRELEKMAEICLRHSLLICSDEIHCDLLFPGHRHIPIAALSPEVARSTVTLLAPSKTYNLAGLRCGVAVIQNEDLRKPWKKATHGLNPGVNIMGQVAALAGYREGQEWLEQVLAYLTGNRDFLSREVPEKLPGVRMTRMEATYLAWLDCRNAGIPGSPFEFFLKEARVALNDGAEFGRGGEGFVRLNFACPRKTLAEAVDRMSSALRKI